MSIAVVGAPYLDTINQMVDGLKILPCARTGAALRAGHGTLSFIDYRTTDVVDIAQSLPCIVVDVDDQRPVEYKVEGSTRKHGIPVVIGIYIPVPSVLDTDTLARSLEAQRQAHDDLFMLHGDLETLLTSNKMRSTGMVIDLEYSLLSRVDTALGNIGHIRARISELGIRVWRTIAQT